MCSDFTSFFDVPLFTFVDTDRMENNRTPSSALEELGGAKIADTLYEHKLAEAKTIGDVRRDVQSLLSEVGSEGKIGERMQQISASIDQATESDGHDDVAIADDLGSGVLGQNKLGAKESVMRRDQLDPAHITTNTRNTMDTVLHENSEDVGHAGQDPNAVGTLSIIDARGKRHDPRTVIEGEVVSGVSHQLGRRRAGLPKQTYLEGADLVEEIGAERVRSYVRKGGANVGNHLQQEVWRKQPGISFDEMMAQGSAVGMSEDQIRKAAEEQGKLPEGREAGVALAA